MTMKASEILAKTLELWGPNGEHWTQGDLEDFGNRYCLVGGISKAAYGYASYHLNGSREMSRAVATVRKHTDYRNLIDFNDMGTRAQAWPRVKGAVCKALRDCLEQEAKDEHS